MSECHELRHACHVHRVQEVSRGGEATHTTSDHRISNKELLVIQESSLEDIIAAIAKDALPNICELLTDRMRMFFELRNLRVPLTDEEIKLLVREMTRCLGRFFPASSMSSASAYVLLPDALENATTHLRVVYPSLVVDTGKALRMHALLLSHLFQTLQDSEPTISGGEQRPGRINLRAKLSPPPGDDHEVPCYLSPEQTLGETLPNVVYAGNKGLQVIGVPSFSSCRHAVGAPAGSSKSSDHAYCPMCYGSRTIAHAQTALRLKGIFSADGSVNWMPATYKDSTSLDDKVSIVRSTMLRTHAELTPWKAPPGCPYTPQKRDANGRLCMRDTFPEDSSTRTTSKRTEVRELSIIGPVVQNIHEMARYAHAHVVHMFRIDEPGGKYTFRVLLGGCGAHWCGNIQAEHTDGRVFIEISRLGLRQRCNSKSISGCNTACKVYKPEWHPLTPAARRALGYPTPMQMGGGFWCQLNVYLAEAARVAAGGKPARAEFKRNVKSRR